MLKVSVAAVPTATQRPSGRTRTVAATASPWSRKNAV